MVEEKKEGWIKWHRCSEEDPIHPLNNSRPFTKYEAWQDVVFLANYKDKPWIAGTETIIIPRCSFVTSEIKLMERWRWSKSKVRAFLKFLENDLRIIKKADNKKTTLTVVNYEKYQSDATTKEPKKDFKKTSKRLQKDTTKESKEDKEIKNIIPPIVPLAKLAEYVTMTNGEYEKLIATYGKEMTAKMIEVLDNYKGSSGKKYKNDYRAILNWVVKRIEEEKNKPPIQQQKSRRISHVGGRDLEKMYGPD